MTVVSIFSVETKNRIDNEIHVALIIVLYLPVSRDILPGCTKFKVALQYCDDTGKSSVFDSKSKGDSTYSRPYTPALDMLPIL